MSSASRTTASAIHHHHQEQRNSNYHSDPSLMVPRLQSVALPPPESTVIELSRAFLLYRNNNNNNNTNTAASRSSETNNNTLDWNAHTGRKSSTSLQRSHPISIAANLSLDMTDSIQSNGGRSLSLLSNNDMYNNTAAYSSGSTGPHHLVHTSMNVSAQPNANLTLRDVHQYDDSLLQGYFLDVKGTRGVSFPKAKRFLSSLAGMPNAKYLSEETAQMQREARRSARKMMMGSAGSGSGSGTAIAYLPPHCTAAMVSSRSAMTNNNNNNHNSSRASLSRGGRQEDQGNVRRNTTNNRRLEITPGPGSYSPQWQHLARSSSGR